MLLSTVDVIFADVAQPDQARIVIHNAQSFLKDNGHVVISIKASCVDSTAPPDEVFRQQIEELTNNSFKAIEQVTLEPYERDHAMVSGAFFQNCFIDMAVCIHFESSYISKTRKTGVV